MINDSCIDAPFFFQPAGSIPSTGTQLPRTQEPSDSEGSLTPPELPNIIFLLADDLGYGDVGYNGGRAETPNLDAMASGPHSIKLDRFYSGGPVCSPTRGTLLTGRNHNRYCLWRANTVGRCGKEDLGDFSCPTPYPLPESETTVAEILRKHGYHTAVFGKWHLGDLKSINGHPTSHPGQHGFDVWKVTERSAPTVNLNCACFNSSLCVVGHYNKKDLPPCTNYHSSNASNNNLLISHNEPIIDDDSNFLASEFASFLDSIANSSKPFFAYIPFHTVHKRYIALPSYLQRYKQKGYTSNEMDYYGAITAMDDAIGRIRTLLAQHNIANNTMIWFASDNGPEFKSPGSTAGLRGRKRDLYEGGIRVPGIIEWPAVLRRNRVSRFPVVTTDFLPTVCEIIGADLPENRIIDGTSVLSLIRNQVSIRRKPIMWAFNIKGDFSNGKVYQAVVTKNRYKAIVEYRYGQAIQSSRTLYDLIRDPLEEIDISLQHPRLLSRMASELETWRQSLITSAQIEVGCWN